MENYVPSAKTTIIKFNSRASIKIKDSFYTFEYGEERQIEDVNKVNIDLEIKALTEACNNVVDNEIQEIVTMLQNKR